MSAVTKPPCSICREVPPTGVRYMTNEHGSALCQTCVEGAIRLFLERGVSVAGAGPLTITHAKETCCLCGKAPGPTDCFITNGPSNGTACGPCIEICYDLVIERKAENADELDGPPKDLPTPTTPEEFAEFVRTVMKPSYLARAKLSTRQQRMVLDWLAPRSGDATLPVRFAELNSIVPTYATLRNFLNDRMRPALSFVKQADRLVLDQPLTPEDRATILRAAIPLLIRSLGAAGSGPALMESFLRRFADRIAAGEPLEVHDVLTTLFAPELRDPVVNEHATHPDRDGLLVSSLIRPTLARLKKQNVTGNIVHGTRQFVVYLVIEGAERSRGPVKQPYRIAVLIMQSLGASLAGPSERPNMLAALERALTGSSVFDRINVRMLGNVQRIIEQATAAVAAERPFTRERIYLAAVFSVIQLLLQILTDDEKAQLLSSTLGLRLRGLPPLARFAPGQLFADWFIDAVDIPSVGTPLDDAAFQRALRLRDSYRFIEKVALMTTYTASDVGARAQLRAQVDRPTTFGPDTLDPLDPFDLPETLARRVSSVADLERVIERWLTPTLQILVPTDANAPIRFM